jgi:prenyltransferase beta subunit
MTHRHRLEVATTSKIRAAILALAVSCLFFALTGVPFAHALDIPAGLAWMESRQRVDGGWGGQSQDTVRSYQITVAVLEALASHGVTDQATAAGNLWLGSQTPLVTEEMAWRSAILGQTDPREAEILATLLSYQGIDGWPAAPENKEETLDTARSIPALKRTLTGPPEAIGRALAFLTRTQGPDGGWGYGENGGSIYLTAVVLEALTACRSEYALEEIIARALGFLKARYQVDGGFGGALFETALAYGAAIRVGDDVRISFPMTHALLAAGQGPDGSWSGDAYTTAVVLVPLPEMLTA